MAVTAVLIDLDGTLWDSAPWYANLLSSDDTERRTLTESLRQAKGGPRAATLLKQKYTPIAFARAASDAGSSLRLYREARPVLETLALGYELGVVTSLPGWVATPLLQAVGLGEHFAAIQTAAWRVPAKPHPATLKLALSTLRTPPADAVYLGDSAVDEQAASRAGTGFIGAGWGYGGLRGADVADSWAAVRSAI